MIAVNYSQLRGNLKKYCDKTTKDYETIVITRKNNENVVMLSEEAYNNLLENAYIMSNKANYEWLIESKKQLEQSKVKEKELLEDN